MLFSTIEDKDAGASWQKLLKMPPASANTRTENTHCTRDVWGRASTTGEIPALLKSVRKSPLTSKASTLPKTFTWPAQLLGFTGNVEGWNKFLGLGNVNPQEETITLLTKVSRTCLD